MILPMLFTKTKLLPVYVIRMGVKEDQYDIVRKEGFPGYQILYCTEGSGIFCAEGHEYKIGEGDAFFFRPNVPHEYHPVKKPWKTKWITYAGSAAEGIADYLGLGKTAAFSLEKPCNFDMLVNSMSDMIEGDDPDKEIKISCMLYKIIIKIGEFSSRAPRSGGMNQNEKYKKIAPVVEMIKERFSEDLSLDAMAGCIGVTANHLCRLFNQVYGTTPLKYLTQMRLNMAKNYLCSAEGLKVREVAKSVGFHDASYFCAVFKRLEGMTPDEFRKINMF